MARDKSSFHEWLATEINGVLGRQTTPAPFLLWCDPYRQWIDLLRTSSSENGFELWADPNEHELVVRDRFFHEPRKPRIVWLPCSRDEISWFKVFELEAEEVWERSLLEALREYGVDISREQESELASLLPAHAKEWFDKPRSTWKELTPANAKGALIDDHRMLEVLAGEVGEFEKLKQEDRFAIFARRAREDFGLPDPANVDEKNWRVAAAATLLCTEAAAKNPQLQPNEQNRIVPAGLPRDNALRLLRNWQENINFLSSFEELGMQADTTVSLTFWARNLTSPPKSYASRAVEDTLFKQYAEELDRIEDVEGLSQKLAAQLYIFQERESKFWGKQASARVGWKYLVQLGRSAGVLVDAERAETSWKKVQDGVDWYCARGWEIDAGAEELFTEAPDWPSQLHRVRVRMRRAYARATDHVAAAFSELLAHDPKGLSKLPTVGESILLKLQQGKVPTALICVDAFRLELGHRLKELLNEGEPAPRAELSAAVAPVPSVTSLGMPFALPMSRQHLHIKLSPDKKVFEVSADGFVGDLTIAQERRKWLTTNFDVRDFYSIADVLDGDRLKRATKGTKIVYVQGAEFDTAGHDGQLQLTGAEDHLDRYVKVVRKLRESGFLRIIVCTDHGFFHWQPQADEVQSDKPGGEALWGCRRAIVGHSLKHLNALILDVPQSNLQVAVPRSFNAFKTYGGLGFFHGGATLQELIIPVVVASWPAKASKVKVVLKPVVQITSVVPRIQVEPGDSEAGLFGADERKLARRARIKVLDPTTGKVIFKHDDPVTIEPGGKAITVLLKYANKEAGTQYGMKMSVQVIDADDEEILASEEVTLKVDLDEW
jgi:hypothetical protein